MNVHDLMHTEQQQLTWFPTDAWDKERGVAAQSYSTPLGWAVIHELPKGGRPHYLTCWQSKPVAPGLGLKLTGWVPSLEEAKTACQQHYLTLRKASVWPWHSPACLTLWIASAVSEERWSSSDYSPSRVFSGHASDGARIAAF